MTLNDEGLGPPSDPPEFADDMMRGAGPIAKFLFGVDNEKTRRKVYHLVETTNFPGFKMGSMVCARRSRLLKWVEDQEGQNGNKPKPSNGRTGARKKPRR